MGIVRGKGECPDCGEEWDSVITHIAQSNCTYDVTPEREKPEFEGQEVSKGGWDNDY